MWVSKHRFFVSLWLITCLGLVASMVLLGGYTRLSGSGLSITEWKPIHGVIPPLNAAQWQEEFTKYQQIPQYKALNEGMTLAEFKAIFWPEFFHRLLGRVIGVVFFIPLVFFWAGGAIEKRFGLRLLGIFMLGGLQGFMGWFMVASGLAENTHISHLRLAAHLSLAFLIFALLLWALLSARAQPKDITIDSSIHHRPLRIAYIFWFALLCVQIIYGAFMAGTHAGLLFDSYPKMNGQWWPSDTAGSEPLIFRLISNPVLIHAIHRTLAIALVLGYGLWWLKYRKTIAGYGASKAALAVGGALALQMGLGVLTVIKAVPLAVALKHQLGALILFGCAVVLLYRLKQSDSLRNYF